MKRARLECKKISLVPRLRFPEFVKEGEWIKKKIYQFAKIYKGKGISKADISKNGVPCIRYGELYTTYNEIIFQIKSKTSLPKEILFLSKINDVIIPASGETKIDIATASCVMKDNVALGGDLNIIRAPQNGIFISHYLNGNLKKIIAKIAQGDTVVHLYPSQIGQLDIALPAQKEQQRIADCLSSLQERITAETNKLEMLKEHKKGLLKQLFPADGETLPKLRFPEFRDAGKWGKVRLSKITIPVSDKATNKDANAVLTLSAEYGLINQGVYFGKKIAGDDVTRYIRIKNNDFVYNDRTTKIYKYGTIKRLSCHAYGIVSPIYKCFRFNDEEIPQFWEWYFEAGAHDAQLYSIINEGAKAGRFNISIHKLLSIFISFPDKLEQQRIANCLLSLDELITAQFQKITLLQDHKKGLMQQLFPHIDEILP